MKQYFKLVFFLFISLNSFSQVVNDSLENKKSKINRWSIEIAFGNSRGIRPYNDGYFSAENEKFLGELNLNSIYVGTRYYLNKHVTFKSDIAFDRFIPTNNKSIDFNVAQFRLSVQTMFNINSLFGIENSSRFKLLPHIGLNIASLKTIKSSSNQVIGSPDNILGIIYGFSPMYDITKRASLFIDFSLINNFRQHHTWDGNVSDEKNNLTGQMSSMVVGFHYSLSKQPKNEPENDKIKKLQDEQSLLENRVGQLETMMNDSDKDGVADYLDNENNSIAGVAVDSRGIMVDINKNGVPDEIERYLEKTYGKSQKPNIDSKSNNFDFLEQSINEGYITAFFDSNRSKPTNNSMSGISFIINYLKLKPSTSLTITGYSDEIGDNEKNKKLALERANSVKRILIESGIEEDRITTISAGEDFSENIESKDARGYVRRVTFKVK